MQTGELPPHIKKSFRPVVAAAHEAELRRALESLGSSFEEWQSGKIDSFELADRIHTFHNGPNRDIYVRFTSRLDPRVLVEYALKEQLIQKKAIPRELWLYLEPLISADRPFEL
jgi:hypothetical protein